MQVAVEERSRRDSDLYRVPLTVGELERGAYPSGDAFWDIELIDAGGVRRVCVRLKSTGNVGVKRCDPDGSMPPAAPDEAEPGTPA